MFNRTPPATAGRPGARTTVRPGRASTLRRALISGGLLTGYFVALVILEIRRPLRKTREPKRRRLARNLAMATISAAAVALADRPVVAPVAALVASRRWGLLQLMPLPPRVRHVAGVVLLDYTLYAWHVLLHRIPALWRFHAVHHIDLDLDASTALRFHFGELLASVPYRLAQVVLLGIDSSTLATWQRLLFLSVLFHHSGIRLPLALERLVALVIVTPRMHGIHHSIVRDEMDSNWSSGLTLWDALHGSLRLNVPQHELDIGVAAFREPASVSLETMLELPFGPDPDWDLLPGTAEQPRPHEETVPRTTLLP
jgi:sterol desaturase/sphingolipid hydroxylase (fatty acid hydroxylase superfamily)